jgi:hypothetical protein
MIAIKRGASESSDAFAIRMVANGATFDEYFEFLRKDATNYGRKPMSATTARKHYRDIRNGQTWATEIARRMEQGNQLLLECGFRKDQDTSADGSRYYIRVSPIAKHGRMTLVRLAHHDPPASMAKWIQAGGRSVRIDQDDWRDQLIEAME